MLAKTEATSWKQEEQHYNRKHFWRETYNFFLLFFYFLFQIKNGGNLFYQVGISGVTLRIKPYSIPGIIRIVLITFSIQAVFNLFTSQLSS